MESALFLVSDFAYELNVSANLMKHSQYIYIYIYMRVCVCVCE
jgi:hypothetical protein